MKPLEEIKKDRRLAFINSVKTLFEMQGYITLSNGRKGTFIAGHNENGMEHVSVMLYHKLPTWNEMCEIKDIFWNDEETVVQLHPKKSAYTDICDALHLWRPVNPEEWNRIEHCEKL